MTAGWHDERQAFVQHYETDVLDASELLAPVVGFISAQDPRWLSLINAALTLDAQLDVAGRPGHVSGDGISADRGGSLAAQRPPERSTRSTFVDDRPARASPRSFPLFHGLVRVLRNRDLVLEVDEPLASGTGQRRGSTTRAVRDVLGVSSVRMGDRAHRLE